MTGKDVNRIRGVVKGEIGTALKPVTKKLDSVTKKLDILWDQVEKVTLGMEEVKESLDSQTTSLKRIEIKVEKGSDDIQKLRIVRELFFLQN